MKDRYSVILFLTWDCNLKCKYCYETNKRYRNMDFETAKKGVDFFMRYAQHVHFQFFGGEPLLQFELMKKIAGYLRYYYPERYSFSIYTNGTLITNEVLGFIKENKVHLTLSIDGNKTTQDMNRVYKNGQGTFDTLEPILDKVITMNLPRRIRMTVTPNNCMYLFENIKFFYEKYNITDIQEEVDRTIFWEKKDIDILIQQYKNIVDYLVDHYKADESFYWSNYETRILPFINNPEQEKRPRSRCGSSENMCSMDTDGTFYPCQKFIVNQTLPIGNVDEGFNETQRDIVRNFILPNYLTQTRKCRECECVSYCFAGCVADNYILDTDQKQDCDFRRLHKGMHKLFYDELQLNNISPRLRTRKGVFASTCGAEGCGSEGGVCGGEGCGGEGMSDPGCGSEGY